MRPVAAVEARAPAGIAYGYRQANRLSDRGDVIRGLREIDADQADIVRRIFREIASGRSALQVAQSLNAEGIRGPRGGTWSANTITGERTLRRSITVRPSSLRTSPAVR